MIRDQRWFALRLLAMGMAATACADYGEPRPPVSAETGLEALVRSVAQVAPPGGVLRVLISRDGSTAQPAIDTTVTLSVTDTAISLILRIPVVSTSERFQLDLTVSVAGIVLFHGGPTAFTFSGRDNDVSVPAPAVTLAGPSARAAAVKIGASIPPLLFGATAALTATVKDSSGLAITDPLLRWRALDDPVATVDPLTGLLLARQKRGTARIVAFVPLACSTAGCTGPADTLLVNVIAPVASLAKISGDNQASLLGQLLPQPIRVQVLGADQLPLTGYRVAFKDSAGGRFAADTVNADANGFAETRWTLAQLLGINRAVASVVGAPGIATVFQATATSGAGSGGLIADWRFTEGAGQTVGDSSGQGNHGRMGATTAADANDPTWITGFRGGGLSFNNSSWVAVTNSSSLEPQTMTVMAWVRAPTSPGAFRYIVAKGGGPTSLDDASYAIYTGGGGGAYFYVGTGGVTGTLSPSAPATIWNGSWHHLAGTFDGSIVRLFVDGIEVGQGTSGGTIGYGTPQKDLYLGAPDGVLNYRYVGDLDEVKIFGRALTQVEIIQQGGLGAPPAR